MLRSITGKMIACFIVIITAVLAGFGYLNYQSLKADLLEDLKARSAAATQRLARSLPAPIWNLNEQVYNQILDSEISDVNILGIGAWSGDEFASGRIRDEDDNVVVIDSADALPQAGSYYLLFAQKMVNEEDGDSTEVGDLKVFIGDHVVKKALRDVLLKEIFKIASINVVLIIMQFLMLTRLVGKPLHVANLAVKDIAEGEGDLRQRLNDSTKDEVGRLAFSFNTFISGLQKIVEQVMDCSNELSCAAERAADYTEQTKEDLNTQKIEISSLATAVTEMAASAQEVANSAEEAAASSKGSKKESEVGQKIVDKTVKSIESLAAEVTQTSEVIHQLEGRSDQIGSILDVIRGIAEQTNLLALNAAIEAARAGEQGRGFAVVADEVRTLAQRTQQSTDEIQGMISQLQTESKQAVSAMEVGRKKAAESVATASEAGDSLKNIYDSVAQVADMAVHIATAAEQQRKVTAEIDQNIVSMISVIEGTVEITDKSASGVELLKELSFRLDGLVHKFKV